MHTCLTKMLIHDDYLRSTIPKKSKRVLSLVRCINHLSFWHLIGGKRKGARVQREGNQRQQYFNLRCSFFCSLLAIVYLVGRAHEKYISNIVHSVPIFEGTFDSYWDGGY